MNKTHPRCAPGGAGGLSLGWLGLEKTHLWRRRGSWNDVDMSHVQIGLHVLEVV